MRILTGKLALAQLAGCGVALLLLTTAGVLAESDPGGSDAFAFVGVSVIPMDRDGLLANQTVIVRAGRIVEIGPAATIELPDDVSTIEAEGQFLMPAFCDMHVHLLGESWNLVLPPEGRSEGETLDTRPFLLPYLVNGVTTVQVLSATPDHLDLRRRIQAGQVLGPRLILARMIDAPERAWPPPLSTWVASPDEGRQAVVDAKRAGYDAMKVYSFLDQVTYDAIVGTALREGIDVIGHVPIALSLEHVLGSGQRLIAHSEELIRHAGGNNGPEEVAKIAASVADSGVWVVPTLATTRAILGLFDDQEALLARPEAEYFRHPIQAGVWSFIVENLYRPIPPEQREAIRRGFESFQRPFTKALQSGGGRLLAGTDSSLPGLVPGFALHRELKELVGVGLTPFEALRSATVSPVEYLGESGDAGTVEVGKRAELVLLAENPLVDIDATRTVVGTMTRGRWLPRQALEAELNAALPFAHPVP